MNHICVRFSVSVEFAWDEFCWQVYAFCTNQVLICCRLNPECRSLISQTQLELNILPTCNNALIIIVIRMQSNSFWCFNCSRFSCNMLASLCLQWCFKLAVVNRIKIKAAVLNEDPSKDDWNASYIYIYIETGSLSHLANTDVCYLILTAHHGWTTLLQDHRATQWDAAEPRMLWGEPY